MLLWVSQQVERSIWVMSSLDPNGLMHPEVHTKTLLFGVLSQVSVRVCVCVRGRAGGRARVGGWVGGWVCNPWNQREPLGLEQGRTARHTHRTQCSYGMTRDGWTDHPRVPVPLFRKTGGNGTRHTCALVYSTGLQVGLPTL